jgi:hypothetical protein
MEQLRRWCGLGPVFPGKIPVFSSTFGLKPAYGELVSKHRFLEEQVMSTSGVFPSLRFAGFQTRCLRLASCAAIAFAPTAPLVETARAQCCGDAVVAPAATQTYRLDVRTVYDEEQVTAYRVTLETVYDTKTYTVQKPVWETQTQERRYTVQKPVWETQTREERTTVMKPVYETQVVDRSYDVVRDVVETASREERYTVMKPVYETAMQQQVTTVRRPVYETSEREEAYTVAEPVTTMHTAYSVGAQAVDTVTPVVTPGTAQLGWVPGGWGVNPYTGLMQWQRGGYAWAMTPGAVVNQVNRAYQPTYTPVQVPQTTMVNRVVTRRVPVQTVRYVDEQVVQQVPVQTMRMVAEEQVRQVPVQTVRKVVERVENKVPVQTMRMVAEEQVRQVPVQVCKMVSEERVEPVSVQVCKYVTEERSMQVPRTVEKRVPYTYTVRKPRTVVMRVPLDPCGNPLPASATAAPAGQAPTAAARPAVPAAPAPTTSQKTFGDTPASEPARQPEGWGGSNLRHVDPETAGSVRAQKPVEGQLETIPAPAAKSESAGSAAVPAEDSLSPKQEPSVAPLGPAVEPAPPAGSTRDVPAAKTSAAPQQSGGGGQTT